jgi:subtilisin
MLYIGTIFTMRVKKALAFIFLVALTVSCKKTDNDDPTKTTPNQPACEDQHGFRNGNIIDEQYIVVYKTSSSDLASLQKISGDLLQRNQIRSSAIKRIFKGVPGGFVAHLSKDEAGRLGEDPAIEGIEPDRVVALSTCFTVADPRLVTWNVRRTGFGDGTGKTAWIIDTGIDFDHPDLTVDQQRSKSFINGVESADDDNGHGTHIAGVIGAKNNDIGVMGVAAGATLVSLKALDKDGNGELSAIIEALGYVSENGHAGDVVNLSVGEDNVSTILDDQVKNTAARGIYVAIAAGNDRELAANFSPGRANGKNIFTVSAIDSLDNFASFSNYGNEVIDYAAPGVRILSTYKGGKYAYMSGTSMASPHVAGLLLLKGNNITTSGHAKNDPDGTPDPIAHY